MEEELTTGHSEMELVDFRILKEDNGEIYEGIYGINVSKVREIIKMPPLTDLPNTPEFIEGIFELRNSVIPVVDLARWMGLTSPKTDDSQRRVIITEFNNVLIGFIVNEAKRIRRVSWSSIEPASFMSGSGDVESSKINGIVEIEKDTVLLILDLESVIQDLGLFEPDSDDTPYELESFSGMALILDDSATARKIVKDQLEKMGFSVMEAGDGQEGLDKLTKMYEVYGDDLDNKLKIIISDIEMPRMDGYTFARTIKADSKYAKIPILFNSGISDSFSDERAKEAGGDGYLVKFETSTFYDEIARVVRAQMK